MDVKAQIEKAVNSILNDAALREQFQKDPVKAVEKVIGVDLPDDITEQVVSAVKAKISVDKVSDALGAIKKLF